MAAARHSKYLFLSVFFHVFVLLAIILGYESSSLPPVIEMGQKNEAISVVILGDSPKSKILPRASEPPPPVPKVIAKPKTIENKKADIAIKVQKQKLLDEAKKKQQDITKALLADIEKQSAEQKKLKQKQLKSHFEKTLRDQAELSLRQQLVAEDIHVTGKEPKEAQGEIDKYKALILQAISEHWIVPSQANRSLFCELMISLEGNGTVVDVHVTKTSGDPSLDSSARAAVLKASPLPVPKDKEAAKTFRQFVLKVKPENVVSDS